MSSSLATKLWDLASRLLDDADEALPCESGNTKEELYDMVSSAKAEWVAAQAYFNHAVEPELVDHAILSVQAAERKYMYWLKKMKSFE